MKAVEKKGFNISINMGVSSAFVLLIILTTLSLCSFIFVMLRTYLREDLRKQIQSTVSVGALFVDGDINNRIVSQDQESGDDYKSIKDTLKRIKQTSPDINFIYTMRENPSGEFVFVVDADESDQMSHTGDVYKDPTKIMRDIFADKTRAFIESETSTDEWGTWLSGFAPITTKKGEFAGILGIDISAQKIIDYETTSFLILVIISAIVCVLVVISGIIISKRITMPLKILEQDMVKITQFRLEEDVTVKSVFREIKSMAMAITNMKGSLRSFRKYVPADLVAQLITMNKEARLGGERKQLSIFFSDIEGSTTLGEMLQPEELVIAMAGYFSGMTRTVLNNKGTVDKFIGDCVMAFWNAPTDNPDHAFSACKAAIECKAFERLFNEQSKGKGLPPIKTRIGINTGEVIVGNIGYEARLNYTVLGDHVNLASRLEGINKYYHTWIVISGNTFEIVKGRVVARILDNVVVKGKTEDIPIYELLALKDKAEDRDIEIADLSNRAFESYMSKKWDEAINTYSRVLEIKKDDYPSRLIIERAKKYKVEPPPANWHGAIVLRDK
jgi:class 3 adenylate cyclase